jgi:integrase
MKFSKAKLNELLALRAQAELMIDIRAEKAASPPFGKVIDLYLAQRQDRRPETLRQANHHLRTVWAPLHKKPIAAITRADVAVLLEEMVQARGRIASARARARLSALFAWAIRRGMLDTNVVVGTENPGANVQPRDRVLDDGEVGDILNACGDDMLGQIVRLLVLTGCRADEIAGLCWDEIDFDTATLTIPRERIKNARTLILPLPEQALAVLRVIPRKEGCKFVFASNKGTAFSNWSYSKLALDARIAKQRGTPLNPWRIHDLRRTARTGLGKLGVPPHIAELCINHVPGNKVQATYDRHKYQPEIKAALAAWANHIELIVTGKLGKASNKIVPLRA